MDFGVDPSLSKPKRVVGWVRGRTQSGWGLGSCPDPRGFGFGQPYPNSFWTIPKFILDLAPKTLGFGLRPYPNPFGVRTRKDPNPLGFGPTPQPNPYWVWTQKDSNPNPTPLGPDMHPAPNPIGSGHRVSPQPILGPDREGPKPILSPDSE